ncbi:putative Protochlorophyllide reductase [Rubrivivax sp. A210]|uniref:SDR family oxidoreductase n=1 Tax=Rubrivivax sp. A210 TaxID=2772301 RepID=UPI001919E459|nr:SDR family oxidoreductase [Rubrivivax sp. A210]CAD5373218.1 putative Protochlorophyllide reductase [Rubrivivax sp. A210]
MSQAAPGARRVVITGTTHGIGRVTARELARAGCAVTMLVRDTAAGERVRDEISALVPGAAVEVVRCDLAELASVRAAAATVRERLPRIDRLIHNAGIVAMSRQATADGFERVFATNHLGPFLLTELLVDRLAPGSRVILVASCAHVQATLDLGQVIDTRARYRPQAAYAQSKLANVLHAFALARRLAGRGITANALHPGVVTTNLLPRWLQVLKPLLRRGMIDAEAGARCTLKLALDEALAGVSGAYFDEHGALVPTSALARDVALQEALWVASARWVGL